MSGRMERALANMFEALPVFLPLAVLARHRRRTGGWALTGAAVFFFARVAYVPPMPPASCRCARGVWAVGHAGLVMMVVGLLRRTRMASSAGAPHIGRQKRGTTMAENAPSRFRASAAMLWFAGWLFTLGFLELGFWKGLIAVIIWPYYIGTWAAALGG